MPHNDLVAPSTLRREFSSRLSALYAEEVPLCGQLVDAVRDVNRDVIRGGQGTAIYLDGPPSV